MTKLRAEAHLTKRTLEKGPVNPINSFLLNQGKQGNWQMFRLSVVHKIMEGAKGFTNCTPRNDTRLIRGHNLTYDGKQPASKSWSGNLVVAIKWAYRSSILTF